MQTVLGARGISKFLGALGWGGGTQLAKRDKDRALKAYGERSELIQATE